MNQYTRRPAALLIGALMLVGASLHYAAESAPTKFNFQGRLTNAGGSPVTTPQSVRFTLIQGGTATEATTTGTIVYQEDATVTPDNNGVFGHVVGQGTPVGGHTLIEADFITGGPALFMELTLGGSPLLPRTQVLSVGYAIESSRLDGKSAAEIIGEAGGSAFANSVVRNGAGLEWQSVSQVKVKPGTLGFSDGKVRQNAAPLTWDFANANSPLGLDTGTEAANAWYYMYAIPDPNDDAMYSAVASTGTPAQIGGSGPAGYGIARYLGAFRNDSTSNIIRFHRSGPTVSWGGNGGQWWGPSGCTGAQAVVGSWVSIDATGRMPATSRAVVVGGHYDAYDSSGFRFLLGPGPAPPPTSLNFCSNWGAGAADCNLTIPTISRTFSVYPEQVGGFTNTSGQCTMFFFWGYEEDLGEF